MTMNPAHTVRLHSVADVDMLTGDYDVVSVSAIEPAPTNPVVRDTGRRVFQCTERAADALEIFTFGQDIQVQTNDGSKTCNIYLTRSGAYELGAALFALADTLRA